MKKFLPTLVFLGTSCFAQNYQCLQAGMKHYFINGNGYLRGIRVDSVSIAGSNTVYYPNHTPRGPYSPGSSPALDTNGGSWLGKRVVQKSDGTFIFDSYWNDSVIIRTRANIGDSWVFYSDAGSVHYRATLIARDTMKVLSAIDSVQKIMINAYNGSGIVTSDPLDSFVIILSKNYGFAQVCDLYTFPYHKPDSAYRTGLDFFLDRSFCSYSDISYPGAGTGPNASVALFRLVNFINPNDQLLHNWNVGDILEGFHKVMAYPSYAQYTDYILDTVSSKIVSGHAVNYTLTGTYYACTTRPGYCTTSTFYSDPCALIIDAGTRIYYDTVFPFIDTISMPEENVYLNNYVFYYPSDSSFCTVSPGYVLVDIDYSLRGEATPLFFKLGIGETKNTSFDDDCILFYTDELDYTNMHGISCGSPHALSLGHITTPGVSFRLFPNPAATQLIVQSTGLPINLLIITNLLGETVCAQTLNTYNAEINVSNLQAGVYIVHVNGTEVRKFVKL